MFSKPAPPVRSFVPYTLVSMPSPRTTWFKEVGRRLLLALLILLTSTLVVYLDRNGYSDNVAHDGLSLIDALYYSTVTITTTGYGDITPMAPHTRLLNALVVTPLRIAFLVLLASTTIEILTNEGRRVLRDNRWRRHMRNHIVVAGYGTMGRSATATLTRNGIPNERILVLDSKPEAVAEANRAGLVALPGDGTHREVLRRAEISKARQVIITINQDAAAILMTLTIRQLNPSVNIIVAVREQDNAALLRQSGANTVITSSDMVGHLLGISSISPHLGLVIEDLLTSGEGLEVAQRQVQGNEAGLCPKDVQPDRVVAVLRNRTLRRYYDPTVAKLQLGDELIVVRGSDADTRQTQGRTSAVEKPFTNLSD